MRAHPYQHLLVFTSFLLMTNREGRWKSKTRQIIPRSGSKNPNHNRRWVSLWRFHNLCAHRQPSSRREAFLCKSMGHTGSMRRGRFGGTFKKQFSRYSQRFCLKTRTSSSWLDILLKLLAPVLQSTIDFTPTKIYYRCLIMTYMSLPKKSNMNNSVLISH